jgi:hypothetical protein
MIGCLALATALSACSGQAPTSPTATSGSPLVGLHEPMGAESVLTFVSGETGEPAVGVDVLIGDGDRYRTDHAGQIRLTRSVTLPTSVEASSPAYLLRETVLRLEDASVLTLWPRHSPTGLDEAATRQIVYTDASGGAPGGLALRRLPTSRVSIVPSAAILSDPAARAVLSDGAATLSAASGGEVQFVVEDAAGPGILVRVAVDPADPAMGHHSALTYRSVEAGQITGARVVFASLAVARSSGIVTHELGHVFGLEHSQDPRDLMYPMVAVSKRLSGREALAIDLMLKRRPGNRFPDNDRLGGAVLGREMLVVACGDPQ